MDNYFPKYGTFLPGHGKAQPDRSKAIYPTGDHACGHHVLGALKYRKPIPAIGPERWKCKVFTCPVNPVGMTIFAKEVSLRVIYYGLSPTTIIGRKNPYF